ncbi:structural maintenance of chromosomes protein 1A-like [Nasonia vitripennis]|uniref:Structural maintenance of chromosomes protein n=1 Tax=Nasonia vitripennis TaxID=7425 RepID=A0A7M7IQ14_NASVI|nr:structural maintenance of chromosomes protein 1A-like [Nasonia vitripennis]
MPGSIGFPVLELENFKSYKNRTRFEWAALITAVVGLNGTGKSSVVNAIQYACCFPEFDRGVTVKHIKEDICNSEIRDSEDPSDTWVELILDVHNTQTNFRRITDYRNSVHRYCINGEEVSRIVYKRSLLQYNINPKINTFLVQQGGIERFATQSPKELCELFERLSGSYEFKAEYTRLEKELQRLRAEASEQKNELAYHRREMKKIQKIEAEWAEIRKLEDDYNRCEYEYYFAKLYQIDKTVDDLVEKHDKLEINIKIAQKIQTSTEEEIKLLVSMFSEREESLALMEAELEEARRDMLNYSTKEAELKEKLALYKNKIKKIEDNLKDMEKKVEAHKNILKDLAQQKMEVEKEREFLLSQSQASSLNLNDEQNEIYLQLKSEALKKCSYYIDLISSKTREQSAIRDQIDEYKAREETILQKVKKQKLLIDEIRSKELNVYKKINETEEEHTKVQINLDELKKEIEGLVESKEQSLAAIDLLNKKIDEQQETKQDQIESSRKQIVLKELKAYCTGVHDRLINLCEVGAENLEIDKLEISITKILGKKMDHIIVDETKDALNCIYFLKEKYKGSKYSTVETFIPLDGLKKITFNRGILQGEENARLAIDVMAVSEKYKDALTSALGNVVICDTDERASELSKNKKLNCVSYNGTLYKKDGTFSGGLSDLSIKSKKKWNEKKLQNLENEKVEKMTILRKQINDIDSKNKQIHELESKLMSLEKRLKEYLKPLLQNLQKELTDKKNKLAGLENLLNDQKNLGELEKLENEFKSTTNELEKVEKKKEDIENSVFSDFCATYKLKNIQEYEMGDLEKYTKRDSRKKELDNLLDKINNQIDFENSCILESQAKVQKLQDDLQKTKKKYDVLNKKNNKIGKQHDTNKLFFSKDTEVKKTRQEVEELSKKLKMKETKMKSIKRDLEEWGTTIRTIKAQIALLENKKHKSLVECKDKNIEIPLVTGTLKTANFKSELIGFKSDTDKSSQRSSSESGIEEKNVEVDYTKLPKSWNDLGEDGLNNTVKTLKDKLKSLHEKINQDMPNAKTSREMAIKARANERALKKKYEDKLKELSNTSKDFNNVKNNRLIAFRTFFSSVEEGVGKHFKTLYNSTTAAAHLVMRNQDEPYLDGLDFSCIVPNKRFIQLQNLSGGEKTMCSIALLFALNSVKPSPFLIFDEMDAALDNANINRMAKFFWKLKNSTQMIIISHHDLICVCADAVVGVNISPITNSSYTCHLDVTLYSREVLAERNLREGHQELPVLLRCKMQAKFKKSKSRR